MFMPKTKNMSWIIFALLAAVTASTSTTLSKAAIKGLDSHLVFAIQAVMIIIVSWAYVAWQGDLSGVKEIEGKTWWVILGAGILTTASSLLSFKALSLGNASQVSPVQQLTLVFAIVFAGIFLKEKITLQVINRRPADGSRCGGDCNG